LRDLFKDEVRRFGARAWTAGVLRRAPSFSGPRASQIRIPGRDHAREKLAISAHTPTRSFLDEIRKSGFYDENLASPSPCLLPVKPSAVMGARPDE